MKTTRFKSMIPLICFLACCLVVSGDQQSNQRRIRKVIIISIDTLRADFLGCYNPKMKTSPNLDQFALGNVMFTDVTSQAATTGPSHKSIFYSVYPSIHKTSLLAIPEENETSPIEILRTNGFLTAAFTGGGQLSHVFGFARGFNTYKEQAPDGDKKHHINELEKQTFDWLDQHANDKFFLFLHSFEVHCPYNPPEHYFEKWSAWYKGSIQKGKCHPDYYPQHRLLPPDYEYIRSLYSAEVNYADAFLGRLFEKLKALGIYDETLIVFLSDHGESLGERGYIGHSQLYQVQLHVPLILHIPGNSSARIGAPMELLDVMPTIFDLLGIQSQWVQFQGRSAMALICGKEGVGKDRAMISEEHGRVRVRIANRVLNFSPDGQLPTELYDLKTDPEEIENLADDYPKAVGELKLPYYKMKQESKKLSALFVLVPGKRLHIDEDAMEQLKALGYLEQ